MKKRRPGDVESPSRNIRHFTNRENERELFARLLHQPTGGHLPVLSFYGVGGTGKSWLVHKLRDIVTTAEEVPQAHLDFSILKGGEIYQRDHAAALAEIQRQLDVPCPRFEVAYNVMLWKQGRRDKVESRVDDTASTGWQIAIALGQDAASALVPGVNVAGKLLEKFGETAGRRLRATALGRWLETRGSSDFLRGLTARTAQEIGAELVDHLARDLHEELPARPGKACRAVLFFDTFEDLVRETGRGPGRDRSARQQWIQDLYRALLDDAEEPRGTVLFVVAGRDKLVWDDDFNDPRYLDQHRVGGLSAAGGDRAEHLRRAVECYEGALRVVTEFAAPRHWASVTENLAVTLVHLSNSLLGEGGLMTRDQALARAACLARARDSFLAAERGFRQVGLDDDADVSARNARTCEAQIGQVGC
jgi:hypothetical protein